MSNAISEEGVATIGNEMIDSLGWKGPAVASYQNMCKSHLFVSERIYYQ